MFRLSWDIFLFFLLSSLYGGLAFNVALSWWSSLLILLVLFPLLRLLLFLFWLVFRWHRIQDSWRLGLLLVFDKRRNVDYFSFVLIESSDGNIKLFMGCSITESEWFHQSVDQLGWNLKLLGLDDLLFSLWIFLFYILNVFSIIVGH